MDEDGFWIPQTCYLSLGTWHLGHNQIIAQEQEPIDLQEIHVLSAVFKIDGCHFVSQSVP